MENVKEYKVVTDRDFVKFVQKVNTAIKDGWQPIGGVSSTLVVAPDLVTELHCQAMGR